MDPSMRLATVDDRAAVAASVVDAFRADPAFRYFFPDDDGYDAAAGAFCDYLFDKRVARDTIWIIDAPTDEGSAARRAASVAMWSPPDAPGFEPADAARALTRAVGPAAAERLERYESMVDQAIPDGPKWYLGILATHSDHAGRRLGRQAMAPGLARAAADRVPAYLETTSHINVGIYERSGWVVESELAVDDLAVWVLRHDG